MKALRIWIHEGEWTRNVSPIVDPTTVVDLQDTILDEHIQDNGAVLDLPCAVNGIFGQAIKQIKLPAMRHSVTEGVYLVNQIALMFNNVLRIAEEVVEGTLTQKNLQTSVRRFQSSIVDALGGKGGYLNRLCVTSRTRHSLRAVALPTASWGPDWVGIPGRVMESMGLIHGALVMIVRFPAIWDGSCEILRARKTPHNAIEVHPLLHRQLGLDHDGDTISVYVIPDDKECQEEAEQHVLGFLKNRKQSSWPRTLLMEHELEPEALVSQPQLDDLESVKLETKERLIPTGATVSPHDILMGQESENIRRHELRSRKALAEDSIAIARGLDYDEFHKRVIQVNTLNLMMKIYMGPVGATANKIKILCTEAPKPIQRSAMDVSEQVQQSLLDSKHMVGDIEDQKFMKILGILNRKGAMRTAMPSQVITALDEQGIAPEISKPLIMYSHWAYAGLVLLDSMLDRLDPGEAIALSLGFIDLAMSPDSTDEDCLKVTRALCKVTWDKDGDTSYQTWGHELTGRFWALNAGISEIIKADFPVFQFVGRQQDDEIDPALARAVLIEGRNDRHGICKRTVEMIKGGLVHGSH